jgi:flagellar M-ring protein FliF
VADFPLLNRVSGFAAQPVTRQLALLIGIAASIALGVGVVQWASTPSYEPLFGNMSPSDNATAIDALEANGIQYKLEAGSGLLLVPYEDVPRARMALASEGFPRAGGIGFESLYQEQEMGLSSFMEQARYQRAVEAELARTIAAMDTVKGARVHIAIAKQSAFMRRGQEPSASVMLSLYPGRALSDRQLSGIVHLVASSVPNLTAERVSVVDQGGKLLSGQGQDDEFGYTAEQFRIAQQIESSLNNRVISLLEPILGVGAVRAQVTADVDFTRIERTSESYSPENVLRSEQTSEDIANTPLAAATGIPGALTNNPPGQAQLDANAPGANNGANQNAGEPSGPARESRKVTRNYEVDKTISHIRETPGTLRKLSVAVVLDYMTDAEGNKVAIDQQRLEEINTLVREAVGFDAARGDTVTVINSPFMALPAAEDIPEPPLLEQPWIWQAARAVLAGLAVLVLIFTVLRPLVRYSTSYPQPQLARSGEDGDNALPRLNAPTAEDDDLDDTTLTLNKPAQVALPGAASANYHQTIAAARNMANEQPVRAAYVVSNWIAADG